MVDCGFYVLEYMFRALFNVSQFLALIKPSKERVQLKKPVMDKVERGIRSPMGLE